MGLLLADPGSSQETHVHAQHLRRALATATAVSLTGGLLTLSVSAATAATPAKYADDFNGDGYRDYAAAGLGGQFTVTYGTATVPAPAPSPRPSPSPRRASRARPVTRAGTPTRSARTWPPPTSTVTVTPTSPSPT
ncbi:hypothetical protein [Streptomyces sp. P17]|uniref:hypothetical protein n=1 Tax=Streptomyces sp. P17 TaxID=3074716 RepID=UPI0028F3EF7B|nr:hypothetical protein [Streptomyces sp. P17]MDT9699351.1 hypothetical protein [Streptomyces sp. P17]